MTSKRRTLDQLPGDPEGVLARTRYHMVRVGKVLVVNCEAVTVWVRTRGEGKLLLSSTCRV